MRREGVPPSARPRHNPRSAAKAAESRGMRACRMAPPRRSMSSAVSAPATAATCVAARCAERLVQREHQSTARVVSRATGAARHTNNSEAPRGSGAAALQKLTRRLCFFVSLKLFLPCLSVLSLLSLSSLLLLRGERKQSNTR